jgi:hypothetical protein
MKAWLTRVLLVICLTLMAALPSGCGGVALTAREAYELAQKAVTEQYPGAYLVSAQAGNIPLFLSGSILGEKVPDVSEDGKCSRWWFRFFVAGLAEKTGDELSVTVEGGKTRVEKWPLGNYYLRMKTEQWQVDSPQAVQIAIKEVGTGYDLIEAWLSDPHYFLTDEDPYGRPPPEWQIKFGPLASPQTKGVTVHIRADTGQVTNIEYPEYQWRRE